MITVMVLFTGYYSLRASADGGKLLYDNFNTLDTEFSWAVPGGLIGKFSHVALVIDNLTNVTAYVQRPEPWHSDSEYGRFRPGHRRAGLDRFYGHQHRRQPMGWHD